MQRWNTVAIVGVGLIGGSIGLALRARGLAQNVVGIGRREASLICAREAGAITAGALKLEDGVSQADIIVVCTSVADVADHILRAAAASLAGALLTDAASTKASIVAQVEAAILTGKRFVGSHPLAGSEKSGVQFARADLFEKRVVVLTPTSKTADGDLEAASDFWSALGATIVTMTPDAHDHALASTSHFPHLIAAAVAAGTDKSNLPLTAGGWRDLTRIAAGDPELWTQILLENREHVLKSLAGFEKTMSAMRLALESADRAKLQQLLTEGKCVRDALGS
jgi:prephenate dehydrogenase